MSEWKTVKLSDICTLEKGQQIDTTLLDDSKPYRYINGGIKESGYFDNFNTSGESVLISEGGASCGFINYVNEKFWCGCHCYRLHDIKVFPKYLFHALKANQQRIMALRTGSAMPNIQKSTIQKFELKIHDDSTTQKKVSTMLDKCNELIEKHKQTLEKYDNLIKSRFIEMFGNPQCISNNWKVNPLSDYCIVNPKKSELGPIPDDYELSFIPMQSVSENGDVDTSSIKHYKDVKTGFTYFRENDVLFAKITPCMENGKGGVARKLKNQIGFGSTEFHVLRPIETISNSEWIYRLTTFKTFRKDAENNMTGSAGQRRTPKEFFDKYKVGLPPIELQNDFASFVQQIDKSKFAVQKSLEKAETLNKSLMQEYFG